MWNKNQSLSNQFRILETLGGAQKRKFSAVYLVEDKSNDLRSVLKVAQQNETAMHRLRAEAKFTFETGGLPRVADFIENDGDTVLILSYQPGISWGNHFKTIKSKHRLAELIRLLKLLAPILNHIHKNKIVHLDLRPSNLLYDKESDTVSLIDFGMAIRLPYTEQRTTLFPLGYAAPEVLLNEMNLVDYRSDYFSLAVTCFQLLEQRLPLLHPNPSITTNLQLTHPLPDCELLSNTANTVLKKMGAKHQFATPPNLLSPDKRQEFLKDGMDQRYASLDQFIDDLESNAQKRWKLF